jgi:predicted dinucleotide-binding enzyme
LGKKWVQAGHEVVFGVRDAGSEKARAALERAGGQARAVNTAEAIAYGEVVLFSVPWSAVPDMVQANAAALEGKILIDATNNFAGPVINNLGTIQQHAQSARVFRAFNSMGWELFDQPDIDGLQLDLFYTGPEGSAQKTVEGLITDVGLRPLWLGGNDRAALVDNLGALWVTLAFQHGMGRRIALKLLGA